MHRQCAPRLLSLLLLAAVACSEVEGSAPRAESLEGAASEFVDLLAAGRYAEISQRMHFPAIYTEEQLAEDRVQFVATLSSMMDQTGTIVRKEISTDPGPFLQINVAGGSDSYWRSHPAGQGGSTVIFDVEFAKIGPGVVQIAFLEGPKGTEVRSVNIGVKGSRPDARETMEGVMRGLQGGAADDGAAAETTAQK